MTFYIHKVKDYLFCENNFPARISGGVQLRGRNPS